MLEGKVCLVTGCGRGIGRAIAIRFAEERGLVYAVEKNPGAIDAWLVDLPAELSARILPKYLDITDSASVKEVVANIKQEQGTIDVLVNNAGIEHNEILGMIDLTNMRNMFEVNVFALINILQLVSRVMIRQKQGSIINISSLVGIRGNKGQLVYSATKGAVILVTRSAAKELAASNIRVNSIAPGLTNTDMVKSVESKFLENRISNIGFGRLAEPEEIADACVFLASDLSSYISGQIIGVDGCTVL